MQTKTVTKFEIIRHGIAQAQTFEGGRLEPGYADACTGIGETEREALEDAIDCLAQSGWEVPAGLDEELTRAAVAAVSNGDEEHYYLSIQVA